MMLADGDDVAKQLAVKSWILLEVSFEGIHKNVEQVQD